VLREDFGLELRQRAQRDADNLGGGPGQVGGGERGRDPAPGLATGPFARCAVEFGAQLGGGPGEGAVVGVGDGELGETVADLGEVVHCHGVAEGVVRGVVDLAVAGARGGEVDVGVVFDEGDGAEEGG